MINLLWRRLYSAPQEDDDRDKLSIWTEFKKKASAILLAKASDLRKRKSYARSDPPPNEEAGPRRRL
eukprot:scaffold279243_cov22-Tisochrysis_lutea.AAC.1